MLSEANDGSDEKRLCSKTRERGVSLTKAHIIVLERLIHIGKAMIRCCMFNLKDFLWCSCFYH